MSRYSQGSMELVRSALGHGSQHRGVPEHLGQRHFGLDDADGVADFALDDVASAGGEVARDVSEEFVGGHDLDLHDGLEESESGLGAGLSEGECACLFEGDLAGVDVVVGTEDQFDLDVDHGVAADDAAGGRGSRRRSAPTGCIHGGITPPLDPVDEDDAVLTIFSSCSSASAGSDRGRR